LHFEILYSSSARPATAPAFESAIRFEKTASYAAVVRVTPRSQPGTWTVTLIPLAYPDLPAATGGSTPGSPPRALNMRTEWPQSSISSPPFPTAAPATSRSDVPAGLDSLQRPA
jgi:hypothetical protein